ncbi:MAG: protein-ADP-ribose hydrolase [Atopobiaceae bacterium]|nr:protein-ADP-ribose hydrolase [Atopobiaceae bacterium]
MPDQLPKTQDARREWLISALLAERDEYAQIEIPAEADEQRLLLRALFNVRPPMRTSDEFLHVQDAYLQDRAQEKGITRLGDLTPLQPHLYVWRGDITTLAVDGIVNAANSQMLGCFAPNHGCIDNAIHTFAGVQLRLACDEQMHAQGHEERTGTAKITPGFNLPANWVLHTVGPIVRYRVTPRDQVSLASCYQSCLDLAQESGLRSIAFCCISTGEFHYPNDQAAQVAVDVVQAYLQSTDDPMEVVFNVFKPVDYDIYHNLLG